ncbi:hypothetical protein PTSG_12226 [Salpingoeca rosetta]|uniref:Fibrinogen C-terminal domain-containing protein n=1 Tax=Salpingoeca rosetta (strain ATCC 50818 / BSB-021) TaxID=946362 RepID=F2U908_SALR5|nr:uncharacterized protein PTSG_12226 [Salpingoeca rosetta]EGD73211.1 hypothetical protein PTSG_12226 [Salpingoeca rosetta]|eukprot:XP_004994242.1 hypothetical protein PTSG_12226 [Salpingoeca rosetta]
MRILVCRVPMRSHGGVQRKLLLCVYDDFFVTNEGRNQAIQAAEGSSIACVLVDNTNDRISFREPRTPLNDAAFQAFADAARPHPISFSLETLQYTPEEAIFIPPRNTIPRQDPFPFYVTKGGAPRNPTRLFASAPGTCTRIIPAADDAERVWAMCSPGGDLDVPVPADAAVLATYTGITTNIQISYSGCDGDCTIRYNASTQRCINAVQKIEYTIQLGLTTISSLNVAVTVASFDASATRTWCLQQVHGGDARVPSTIAAPQPAQTLVPMLMMEADTCDTDAAANSNATVPTNVVQASPGFLGLARPPSNYLPGNAFGTAGSDNGNGAPADVGPQTARCTCRAGNDICVPDQKRQAATTMTIPGDVQRVNDTVTDVEGALRTEISTTSEVVTDALVPRFSSMEAAIARSFAAINASLAATWSSLDGVNASLTDSIQDVQRHVNRAAAEASMATGELSQEVSTLFEGMGGVVGELTSKLSASESTQTSQADTLLQVQGQISTILSKQADFAAFQKASSRGLVPDSPASTCGEVTSKDDGVYYFSTSTGVFTAFCDFQRDGGKWAKVLQYPGQNYVGWTDDSTGSVGNIATKDLVSSFSKLSDVQINSIKSSASDFRVWKIESGCTNNNLYIITPHSYVDTRIDLGLALDEVHIHCLAPTLAECDGNWNTGDMRGYDNGGGLNLLDTYYVSGDLDQSCNRFFFGHRGSDNHYTCYGPSDNSRRCMSAGSQCTCGSSSNYPPHKDFTIWVKPLDESTVNLVDGLLPDSPAQSCSTVLSTGLTRSQAYYLRAGDNVFRGFCDQTGADGGWLKVLHGAGYQYRDSCTCGQGVDHPVHKNLQIFVKPFSEF